MDEKPTFELTTHTHTHRLHTKRVKKGLETVSQGLVATLLGFNLG